MSKDRRLGKGLAALLGQTVAEEPIGQPVGQPVGKPTLQLAGHGTGTVQETDPAASPGHTGYSNAHPPVTEMTPVTPRKASAVSEPKGDQTVSPGGDTDGLLQLPVDEIEPNPFQPRREFNEPEIVSMAESLKSHDMLQPVLVRRIAGKYQLISGERRLRAAKQAGWSSVPARLKQADDRLVAELAIVENLQRKDLNPIEKALSFKRYLDQHDCRQDELAKRLTIDRSTISNLVRLLELPQSVRDAVSHAEISAGHARALLPLGDEKLQIEYSNRIKTEGISVREIERIVREILRSDEGAVGRSKTAGRVAKKPNDQLTALEDEFRTNLGVRTEIRKTAKGKGRIVLHFANHAEFERIRSEICKIDQRADQRKAA